MMSWFIIKKIKNKL